MLDDGVVRVPSHVDHLQRWMSLHQLPGQLRSAGTRHDDVSQKHVDGPVLLEQLKRFIRVRGDQDRVALPVQ